MGGIVREILSQILSLIGIIKIIVGIGLQIFLLYLIIKAIQYRKLIIRVAKKVKIKLIEWSREP